MTAHSHTEHVAGCFRCDLSREESTPTTEEVRDAFASDEFGELKDRWAEEFDRWLAAEILRAKAEAWDECFMTIERDAWIDWTVDGHPRNPYLIEGDGP